MGLDGSDRLKAAIIRHEQIPDNQGFRGLGSVVEALGSSPTTADVGAFDWAVVFDMQGDYEMRDAMLRSILSESRFGPQGGREGNSLEDLRLSVKGWELGRMIALDEIKTNYDLAGWLATNIASGY